MQPENDDIPINPPVPEDTTSSKLNDSESDGGIGNKFNPDSIYPTATSNMTPGPVDLSTEQNHNIEQGHKKKSSKTKVIFVFALIILIAGFFIQRNRSTDNIAKKIAVGDSSDYKPEFTIYSPSFLPGDYYLQSVLTEKSEPVGPESGLVIYIASKSDTTEQYKIGNTIVLTEDSLKQGFQPPENCSNIDEMPQNKVKCKEVGKTKDNLPIYQMSTTPSAYKLSIGKTYIETGIPKDSPVTEDDILKILESLTELSLTDLINQSNPE